MKKRVLYCFVFGIVGLYFAALVGLSVYGYLKGQIAGGIGLDILAVCCLLALLAMILREKLDRKCAELFEEKKYAEARAYLEKVRKGPLSFLTRVRAMSNYVCVCMALDDLPNAARIIDRLRHGGGKGWKYMTAYCYILIRLDGGDVETARAEYEEFRTQCANAEIYKDQIEVLTAIFRRLMGTSDNEPLPQTAVNSRYPVVGRILGKIYEERAAKSGREWN